MKFNSFLFVFLLAVGASFTFPVSAQLMNKNIGDSYSSIKKKTMLSKGDDYKKVRQKLIDSGWKSDKNPYLDKSTFEVQLAIKLNKNLGFFELQQCFSREKGLISCDVTWTSTGNKENPELFFSVIVDEFSKKVFIEEDVRL